MCWHRVDLPTPLASGERFVTRIEEREIMVCRIEEQLFAVAGRCTHSAWPLFSEPIEGLEIVCTLHGARFDLRDGCPSAGPASKPLATYPVELRNGELFVRI